MLYYNATLVNIHSTGVHRHPPIQDITIYGSVPILMVPQAISVMMPYAHQGVHAPLTHGHIAST